MFLNVIFSSHTCTSKQIDFAFSALFDLLLLAWTGMQLPIRHLIVYRLINQERKKEKKDKGNQ